MNYAHVGLLSHNRTPNAITDLLSRREAENKENTSSVTILCVAVVVTERVRGISVWVVSVVAVQETLCSCGVLGGGRVVRGFVSARVVLVLGELVFVAVIVLIFKLVDVSANDNSDV